MKPGNFLLLLVVVVAMAFTAKSEAVDNIKIGIIDMQFAMNETIEGKKIIDKMQKKLQRENDVLQKKADELKRMQDNINSPSLSFSAKTKKEETFRKLKREFERYQEDKRNDFMNQQRSSTEKVYVKLMKVIKDYSKKEGFTLVLEAGNQGPNVPSLIIFYNDSIDITKKIIDIYDKKTK